MAGFTLFGIWYVIWSQLKTKQINPYILLSVLFVATYASFILFSGGDWMEGGRFLVPLLPVAMMFPALVLAPLLKHQGALVIGITALIVIQMAAVVDFTARRSVSLPAWSRIELQDKFVSFPVPPFELAHRPNIKAIPLIHHLDIILDQLYLFKGDNVYIMSGQMGMVPYHIFQQHFGRVRIIDLYGLTDRTFTNCEVTSGVKKSIVGLAMGYKFYFKNRKSIEDTCGITRPDIIFDIRLRDAKLVSRNGYTVMYLQRGQMNNGSEWLKAHIADEFIAVRNDLVPALDGMEPIHLDAKSLLKPE